MPAPELRGLYEATGFYWSSRRRGGIAARGARAAARTATNRSDVGDNIRCQAFGRVPPGLGGTLRALFANQVPSNEAHPVDQTQ